MTFQLSRTNAQIVDETIIPNTSRPNIESSAITVPPNTYEIANAYYGSSGGADRPRSSLVFDRDNNRYSKKWSYEYQQFEISNYISTFYPDVYSALPGLCGGAAMTRDNITYVINDVARSKVETSDGTPRDVWTCFYDASSFTNTIYLTEYYQLLTPCNHGSTGLQCSASTTNPNEYDCVVTTLTGSNADSCHEALYYYNALIMPTFCGKQHIANQYEPCPNDADTCSTFVASGENGEYCRAWEVANADNTEVLEFIDIAKDEYCLNNPYELDCKCLSRSLYPEYLDLKINSPDYCWYVPCIESQNYLTVSRDKAKANSETCANSCATILTLYNEDVDKIVFTDETVIDINCDFSTAEDYPAPSTSSIQTTSGITITNQSFFDQYGMIMLWIGLGMVGVLVIIMIIVGSIKK